MKHFPNFLDNYLKNFINSKEYKRFIEQFENEENFSISGFNISSFAIFIYHLFINNDRNILVLFSDFKDSEKFRDDLDYFFNKDYTGFLPKKEQVSDPEHKSDIDSFFYNDVKNKLFDNNKYIYISAISNIDIKFPTPQSFQENKINVMKEY